MSKAKAARMAAMSDIGDNDDDSESLFASLRVDIASNARLSLAQLMTNAHAIQTLLDSDVFSQTLSSLVLTSQVTEDSVRVLAPNPMVSNLICQLLDCANEASKHFWNLERHLQLTIPKKEDGNNFGVEILESEIKLLQDRSAMVAGQIQDLSTYSLGRAQIFEKMNLVPVVKVDSTEEGGVIQCTTRSPSAVIIPDLIQYLVLYDTKWIWMLKETARSLQDAYLMVFDSMKKNKDKINQPKSVGLMDNMMY